MFRNVSYNRKTSTIRLWYTDQQENRLYMEDKWVPYVFVDINQQSNIKTIENENVVRKKFNSFGEYSKYQQNNDVYENNVTPEIQYLAEKYHSVNDDDIFSPQLKIFILDIEVHSSDGHFPSPQQANHIITAITVCDAEVDKYYTFGLYQWTDSTLEEIDVDYRVFDTEQQLLRAFILFVHQQSPDIITGWNVNANKKMNVTGFDLPYIVNRSSKINEDKDFWQKLSPVNRARYMETSDGFLFVDIEGVSIIDYQTAYKWYTTNNPESYSLDFISNLELGEGKLQYSEYSSLKRLYEENWNLYIDYNIIDVKRIKQLEDKLGYLKLVQSFSLITKCPMKYFTNMVTLHEGRMLVHYRRNNLCAPKMIDHTREAYPAAYVKTPTAGLYRWVFSIDIKSSYPTAIVTLNMSIETYLGKIISFTEDDIIRYTSQRQFPPFSLYNYNTSRTNVIEGEKLQSFNKMLQKGLICIAPAGICFKTKPEGVIAHVEREMFDKRQQMKKKMNQSEDPIQKSQYNSFQLGLKILINSFYGILAYPYANRYMNPHIAEAITSCGRHAVKQGEKYSNELLNNPNENLKDIINELQ